MRTFAFYGTTMSGAKQQRDRWKRAISATNTALGYAVGRLYVARYFPPAEKKRAEAMVANIIAAFRDRIDRLEWMAPATKREAKAKLAALKVGVGYPDRWPDYSGLEVKPGTRSATRYERSCGSCTSARQAGEAGGPVGVGDDAAPGERGEPAGDERDELPGRHPAAAVLRSRSRRRRMDYGAIGATIGHEVSHSFDDSGALFDSKGRLRNWWTPEDFEHFEASGAKLAAQYDEYRPFPDLAVNGKQTLGENIADLAGLAAAYDAYRASLGASRRRRRTDLPATSSSSSATRRAGADKTREPALRNQILTDGHAPDEYRALTVRNLDAWYSAFGVKPGQALYCKPEERVRIW